MKESRNTGKHEAVHVSASFKAVTGSMNAVKPDASGNNTVKQNINASNRFSTVSPGSRPVQPGSATGRTGVIPASSTTVIKVTPPDKKGVRSGATGKISTAMSSSAVFAAQSATGRIIQPGPVQPQKQKKSNKRSVYILCTTIAAVLIIVVAFFLRNASEQKSYDHYFDTAQQYYASGDYDNSLASLRKAISIEETDDCLLLMASCYEAQANYDKCLEVLRKLDTADPEVSSRIAAIESIKKSQNETEKITIAGSSFPIDSSSLVLKDKGVTDSDLDDIVRLYALNNLTLSGNSLHNISALSSLGGLTTLDLSKNNISDISPLSSLTGLRTLYLDGNPVSDFSALYSLSSLTTLSIKGVEITENQLKALSEALPSCAIHSEQATEDIIDITLGGITFKSDVETLDLSSSGISDISALSSCTALKSLDLSDNNIKDLTPLMDIPGLTTLDISENQISDLRPLMALTSITKLSAYSNSITSTVAISSLTNLTELYLGGNKITDFSGIGKLKSLLKLGLEYTGLKEDDLSLLYKLGSLFTLDITGNEDISGESFDKLQSTLSSCTIYHSDLVYSIEIGGTKFRQDSTELDLSSKNITDISNLCLFPKLESVNLSGNNISNIYSIEWVTSLRKLNLSNNLIEDITAIACLNELTVLDLRNNSVSSILPLIKLSKLEILYLGGNNLTEEQIETLRAALPNCDIHTEG